MDKFKTFIIGVIVGSFLVGGVAYAADYLHIKVKLPNIFYWYDGQELKMGDNEPLTINYNGVNYVPVRKIAEALGKEVEWDAETNRVLIKSTEQIKYKEIEPDEMDPELKTWLDHSVGRELAQVRVIEQETYILLTLGKKNSGGYDINVLGIKQYHDGVKVDIEILDPQKGNIVTESMTHPYKLIKLMDTYEGKITFKEKTDKWIPTIEGAAFIPSIYKETENMILFEPEITKEKINLQGIVNTFEGLIEVSLVDGNEDVLENVTIQSLGAKPNWGYFEKEFLITSLKQNSAGSVVIHTINEKDGIFGEKIKINLGEWTKE
jgi:hypothetical protein